MLKEHLSMPIMTACIIDNFEQLLTIVNNPNQNNVKTVEFTDNFKKNIEFNLKIQGNTLGGIAINGHITADLLNILNDFQDLIYQIYANIVKNKKDARSLTDEEKKMLTLIFQVNQGSTEGITKNIANIIDSLKDMDIEKLLLIVATISIVSTGIFIYKVVNNNNKTKEFLAQNETINNAIQALKDTTIKALNSTKLDIEKAQFGQNASLTKQEIQEMYKDITENEENIEPKQNNGNFIVKKLYKRGNGIKKKNMATLYNENIEIETEIVADLFENNEHLFFESYKNDALINCDIIGYETNGKIIKAILIKVHSIIS